MFAADWLGQAAHSAVLIASFGIWTAGCVLALRRRPATGSGLAATGFGLLALVEVTSVVFHLAFIMQLRSGGAAALPDVVALVLGGFGGVGQIAGAALVVGGIQSYWRASRDEPRREASVADRLAQLETE